LVDSQYTRIKTRLRNYFVDKKTPQQLFVAAFFLRKILQATIPAHPEREAVEGYALNPSTAARSG
jgi:hypothetical protein